MLHVAPVRKNNNQYKVFT